MKPRRSTRPKRGLGARRQELDRALTLLYSTGSQFLAEYPWEWEHDRWLELLVAVLTEGAAIPPATARSVAQALDELRLSSAPALASLASANGVGILARVVERLGVDSESAERLLALLVSVARTVEIREGGKMQRFLRRHGERMKAELVEILASSGMSVQAAEHASTLWLQNTCNIPILARHDRHVRAFLRVVGVTEQELLDSADRMDVNVSILDDLLALSHFGEEGKAKRPGRTLRAQPAGSSKRRQRAAKGLRRTAAV